MGHRLGEDAWKYSNAASIVKVVKEASTGENRKMPARPHLCCGTHSACGKKGGPGGGGGQSGASGSISTPGGNIGVKPSWGQ